VPYDQFVHDEQQLSPSEARARQAAFLERAMRAVTERDEAFPPRYQLFPAAFFYDLQNVWRNRSKGSADARYKSLFESVYADRHTTIAERTFRNWTNGTTSIDKRKAMAFLTVFLENWSEGTGKPLCFCDNATSGQSEGGKSCKGDCEDKRQLCRERLLSRIFTFDGRPQDQIFVLPSPGYSSETVCKHHAQNGWDLLFPVDTAHAHSWDEEHFFRSFSMVEKFVKHRHPVKKPRFIYVLKPFTLMQIDANSRQRATGEAIYRTALERMARLNSDISPAEFSDTLKFIIKVNDGNNNGHNSNQFVLPEELLMPNRLADAFSAQSPAKIAVFQLDLYIKKQMRIHGTKDFQYLVGRNDSGALTYYLTCIPERREEGKWIAARYPLLPLQTLISGMDDPIRQLFEAGAGEGGAMPILSWQVLNFEQFLSLPASRAFAMRKN
jgi:hypothetical protein